MTHSPQHLLGQRAVNRIRKALEEFVFVSGLVRDQLQRDQALPLRKPAPSSAVLEGSATGGGPENLRSLFA